MFITGWLLFATFGYCWLLFDTYGYSWLLLATFGNFGLLWATFVYFWLLLATIGYFWLLLSTVGYFLLLSATFCYFLLLLATFGYFVSVCYFLAILGYFWILLATLCYFWLLLFLLFAPIGGEVLFWGVMTDWPFWPHRVKYFWGVLDLEYNFSHCWRVPLPPDPLPPYTSIGGPCEGTESLIEGGKLMSLTP